MAEDLVKELIEIGLAEKEARVYLASLELGSATAQSIAVKATLPRPTTYIMIESLIKRGLMSSFQKGKKRYFTGATPKQLQYLLQDKQRDLEEKSKILKKVIASIDDTFSRADHDVAVSVFEGIEGLHRHQLDVLSSGAADIHEITVVADHTDVYPSGCVDDIRNDIVSGHKVRSICIVKDGISPQQKKTINTRIIDEKKGDIGAELVIYSDRAAFIIYSEPIKVIAIRSREIIKTLQTLYNALWDKGKNI